MIRSWSLKQQLGKYVVKFLPGRNLEMGLLPAPSVSGGRYSFEVVTLNPLRTVSLFAIVLVEY